MRRWLLAWLAVNVGLTAGDFDIGRPK